MLDPVTPFPCGYMIQLSKAIMGGKIYTLGRKVLVWPPGQLRSEGHWNWPIN